MRRTKSEGEGKGGTCSSGQSDIAGGDNSEETRDLNARIRIGGIKTKRETR